MATMPKRRQRDVHNDASIAMMPALQLQQWQRCQGNVRNDTSVAMVMMPKRRWQRCQRDDHNYASAATATMATEPKQGP